MEIVGDMEQGNKTMLAVVMQVGVSFDRVLRRRIYLNQLLQVM